MKRDWTAPALMSDSRHTLVCFARAEEKGGGVGESLPEHLEDADLVLLLLAAPTRVAAARNRINGILRLEKLVFLAVKEQKVLPDDLTKSYEYDAYNFGPYSKEVYEAVDLLEEAQLIAEEKQIDADALDELEEVESGAADTQGVERRFVLTEDGQAVAQLLGGQHKNVVRALSTIKDEYAGMSVRQLIQYVYSKYPAFAGRSQIRHQM